MRLELINLRDEDTKTTSSVYLQEDSRTGNRRIRRRRRGETGREHVGQC